MRVNTIDRSLTQAEAYALLLMAQSSQCALVRIQHPSRFPVLTRTILARACAMLSTDPTPGSVDSGRLTRYTPQEG